MMKNNKGVERNTSLLEYLNRNLVHDYNLSHLDEFDKYDNMTIEATKFKTKEKFYLGAGWTKGLLKLYYKDYYKKGK